MSGKARISSFLKLGVSMPVLLLCCGSALTVHSTESDQAQPHVQAQLPPPALPVIPVIEASASLLPVPPPQAAAAAIEEPAASTPEEHHLAHRKTASAASAPAGKKHPDASAHKPQHAESVPENSVWAAIDPASKTARAAARERPHPHAASATPKPHKARNVVAVADTIVKPDDYVIPPQAPGDKTGPNAYFMSVPVQPVATVILPPPAQEALAKQTHMAKEELVTYRETVALKSLLAADSADAATALSMREVSRLGKKTRAIAMDEVRAARREQENAATLKQALVLKSLKAADSADASTVLAVHEIGRIGKKTHTMAMAELHSVHEAQIRAEHAAQLRAEHLAHEQRVAQREAAKLLSLKAADSADASAKLPRFVMEDAGKHTHTMAMAQLLTAHLAQLRAEHLAHERQAAERQAAKMRALQAAASAEATNKWLSEIGAMTRNIYAMAVGQLRVVYEAQLQARHLAHEEQLAQQKAAKLKSLEAARSARTATKLSLRETGGIGKDVRRLAMAQLHDEREAKMEAEHLAHEQQMAAKETARLKSLQAADSADAATKLPFGAVQRAGGKAHDVAMAKAQAGSVRLAKEEPATYEQTVAYQSLVAADSADAATAVPLGAVGRAGDTARPAVFARYQPATGISPPVVMAQNLGALSPAAGSEATNTAAVPLATLPEPAPAAVAPASIAEVNLPSPTPKTTAPATSLSATAPVPPAPAPAPKPAAAADLPTGDTALPDGLSSQSKAIIDSLPPEQSSARAARDPISVKHQQSNPLDEGEEVHQHKSVGISISVRQPKLDTNHMLEQAYDALIAGNQEEAVSIYKQVLAAQPNNKLALFGLATTYHRAGQLQLARPLYGRLLTIDPGNKEGLNNFLVLLADESPAEALAEMKKLERSHPDFSPLPAQMAVISEKAGHVDEAIAYMKHAIELSPENIKYRYDMAVMLDRRGDWQGAALYYQELITANERGEKIPANPEEIQQRLTFIRSNKPNS